MSNMLEQAIVDAAALKEAALKNAEAAILEKYAPEIKNAVDQLLTEAPEDEELGLEPEEGMEEDPMAGGEGEEETTKQTRASTTTHDRTRVIVRGAAVSNESSPEGLRLFTPDPTRNDMANSLVNTSFVFGNDATAAAAAAKGVRISGTYCSNK